MAIITAFQAEDRGSIPLTRSKLRQAQLGEDCPEFIEGQK